MANDSVHDQARWEKLRSMAIPEPNSGCLLWLHCINEDGYGVVGKGSKIPGTMGAHRAAWIANFGPIPPGSHVLHKCDVSGCINPAHLRLGTHAENMADRGRKGRASGGRTPGNTILTHDQVRAIRAASGTQREVARRFGVHFQTVNDILRGRTWTHVK